MRVDGQVHRLARVWHQDSCKKETGTNAKRNSPHLSEICSLDKCAYEPVHLELQKQARVGVCVNAFLCPQRQVVSRRAYVCAQPAGGRECRETAAASDSCVINICTGERGGVELEKGEGQLYCVM